MNSFMTESTVKKVNFDYILNEIKPITEYGLKAKLGAKHFLRGQEADLKTEFDKIRAFIELRQRRDIIDLLKHIKNILETIHRARSNQVLDEVELFEIKNFLISVDKMDKILRGISNTGIKLLQLTPLPQLYKKLDPACEKLNTFYIYDEYSQKLKEIRSEKRQIEKTISLLKKKIREEVEGRHNIRLNLKDEVTISKSQKDKADDLNREAYLRVSGENYLNIIYKIKNTDEIDKLEKKYEDLTHEENDEEYRIRQAISASIKEYSHILQKNTETIGEIDYLIARANFAQKTNSVEPEIIKDLQITIKGGRNLKLEKALKEKHVEYVPIDLNLNKNVVCITGANMGGKTVTLRMIGQIAAMASFGMFVPCQYASLCLFEHIFISAGDEQSIDKGLSTFGAEIVGLKEAIKSSGTRSLILIDELAGGTNPKEGYAITKAVVNYLKKKESITVLTTHYDNVANDPDILNLQVKGLKFPEEGGGIDENSIDQVQKYMDYRLIEVKYSGDIPKDALKIARIAGMDEEIIKDAENYI